MHLLYFCSTHFIGQCKKWHNSFLFIVLYIWRMQKNAAQWVKTLESKRARVHYLTATNSQFNLPLDCGCFFLLATAKEKEKQKENFPILIYMNE